MAPICSGKETAVKSLVVKWCLWRGCCRRWQSDVS